MELYWESLGQSYLRPSSWPKLPKSCKHVFLYVFDTIYRRVGPQSVQYGHRKTAPEAPQRRPEPPRRPQEGPQKRATARQLEASPPRRT